MCCIRTIQLTCRVNSKSYKGTGSSSSLHNVFWERSCVNFLLGSLSGSSDQDMTLLTPRKLHFPLMTKHTSVCKQQATQRLRRTWEVSLSWEDRQQCVTVSEQLNTSHACPLGSRQHSTTRVYNQYILSLSHTNTHLWKECVTSHIFWVSILKWHTCDLFQR